MAAEFNNQEEPNDTVFPVNFKENSNLDMYGVWIKKTPEAKTAAPVSSNESIFDDNVLGTDEEINFDEHDIIDLNDLEDDGIRITDAVEHNNALYEHSNEIVEFDDMDGLASMAGITEFDIHDTADDIIEDRDENETLDSLPEFQSVTADITEDNKEKETNMDINEFETLDLDDFLNEDTPVQKETETSQKDEPIADIQIEETSFDSLTNIEPETDKTESIAETSEFDDLLNALEEPQTVPADTENTSENSANDIDIAVTIDEESDISSLAGKTMHGNEDLEDVAIFTAPAKQEQAEKQDFSAKNTDDLIIESTIIEAGNIDKIKEENERILHESEHKIENSNFDKDNDDSEALDSMLDDIMGTSNPEPLKEEKKEDMFFDDVEAVKNDLFDDVPTEIEDTPLETSEAVAVKEPASPKAEQSSAAVLQNDRATEILLQIAGELSSIKTELATLKQEMAITMQTNRTIESEKTGIPSVMPDKTAETGGNGFFTDDDGDETISLTGDELNNILITADFTEENAKDELEETTECSAIPTFEDEMLPNDLETEHINSISEDLSYLEQDNDIFTKSEENTEDYIDMPDFSNEQIEEPNLENFDLTIKELELPDGQSIRLGDAEEIPNTEKTIDTEEAFVSTEISDTPDMEDIVEEPFKADEPLPDQTETLDTINFIAEEPEDANTDDFEIPEELIIDEKSEEEPFSAEDLNETIEDISHLQFDTSAAEEYTQEITTAEEENTEAEAAAEAETITEEPFTAIKTEPAQKQGLSEKAETILSKNAENKVLPIHLKDEIKSVLTYMDQLLESLPEDKIEEFAKSEYFDTYKRLFEELGIS